MHKQFTRSTVLKTSVALVAVVTTLGATAFATAGETGPAQGRPNLDSLHALSVFDDPTGVAMSRDDHELIASILPVAAAEGLPIKSDLAPDTEGRTLMTTSKGARFSAARTRGGQVCWTYRTTAGSVAGCAHQVNDAGINPSGMWNEQGQTLFGLADDTVTKVVVRTNAGTTQVAPMGRNSYHWVSASPSRELYGVAILVTHVDGSVRLVNLPDEDIATAAPAE